MFTFLFLSSFRELFATAALDWTESGADRQQRESSCCCSGTQTRWAICQGRSALLSRRLCNVPDPSVPTASVLHTVLLLLYPYWWRHRYSHLNQLWWWEGLDLLLLLLLLPPGEEVLELLCCCGHCLCSVWE